jgi:spermidine/putrescine transport system ATP-binding protein
VQADLQADHVGKTYAGQTAVKDLSFSVARGSFFSILGLRAAARPRSCA